MREPLVLTGIYASEWKGRKGRKERTKEGKKNKNATTWKRRRIIRSRTRRRKSTAIIAKR